MFNSLVQLLAAGLIWRNVLQVHLDKRVSGIWVPSLAVFGLANAWNTKVQSMTGNHLAAVACAFQTVGNVAWLLLAVKHGGPKDDGNVIE